MAWEPDVNVPIVQAADRAFPDPVNGNVAQPATPAPLSVKRTVPVGALPTIVAVNTTGTPTTAGFIELVTVVLAPDNISISCQATHDGDCTVSTRMAVMPAMGGMESQDST